MNTPMPDIPAAFGLHWSRAGVVASEEFRSRQIEVLRSLPEDEHHALGFIRCLVTRNGHTEAMATLYKSEHGNRLVARFYGSPPHTYRFERQRFSGDWPQTLELVKRILECEYAFPRELGAILE